MSFISRRDSIHFQTLSDIVTGMILLIISADRILAVLAHFGGRVMIEDKDETLVAQKVVTRCTKCKNQLEHVVVSYNTEGIIERVRCHTCGKEHKYRPEKKNSSKKGVRPIKPDPARDFQLLTEKFKGKKPVSYNMSGSFKADDVIDHNTFGMGIVISTSREKIDVVFSDRSRILVCNRHIEA
jgi:hypothetical protein